MLSGPSTQRRLWFLQRSDATYGLEGEPDLATPQLQGPRAMKKYGIPSYTLLIVLIVAWLVGQPGARPLAADQAGGLPALEKRVAALEATVKSQADQVTAL